MEEGDEKNVEEEEEDKELAKWHHFSQEFVETNFEEVSGLRSALCHVGGKKKASPSISMIEPQSAHCQPPLA